MVDQKSNSINIFGMNEYIVEIKEILSELVKVKADSVQEAIEKVEEKYYECKIILDYNSFRGVSFSEIKNYNSFKGVNFSEINDYDSL